LNPGELWEFTGDYEVTQEDIDSNGGGDGFVENTATVSCDELSNVSSSLVLPIIQAPPVLATTESNNSNSLPVANFSANPSRGYAPLSIQFTDLSQNEIGRSWDFNNDGTADSSEENPVYKYIISGTYTAKLTVSNANGTNTTTKTITVLQANSSSSSKSSGGSSHRSGGSGRNGGSDVEVVLSNSTVNSKTNVIGNETVTQAQNSTPTHQKTSENSFANVEQTSGLKNNTSTPARESKRTPGFETICGITGLLVATFFRRR
jgi:PKD repeat protein